MNSFLSEDVADIIISGSNSNLLSGELASLLSGRYVKFTVHPLGYGEYKRFRRVPDDKASDPFQAFLRSGGFPGIHKIDSSEESLYLYLSSLADSVILKDIILRNRIRDVPLLKKLLLYIAANCGNIFSARGVADYFKNERRTLGIETIYNYIGYLEAACVIHRVRRYDLKGKRLLETHEKYYLEDIGLRHALLGYREGDINKYLENSVFIGPFK